MPHRSFRAVIGGVLLLSAAGCGAPTEPDADEESVDETSSPISGGYMDDADTWTVGIVDFQGGSICTGSLIAPNVVLTARHCVSNTYNEASGGGVICSQTTHGVPFAATRFGVTTEQNMFDTGWNAWLDVVEVAVPPTENDLFCGNDVAILILKDSIPAEVAQWKTPRVDSALASDEEYFAIGYGLTSDANENSSGYRRRRDQLYVDCAEEACPPDPQMRDSEWLGDTGICSGDSGGPAVDLAQRVVGVTSRGGPQCSWPIYGSTHSWGDWIKETVRHAAELGGYEAPPYANDWPTDPLYNAPIGGACGECPVCIKDKCSRLCDPNSPCPSGYACEEVDANGTTACSPKPKPQPTDEEEETSCTVSNTGGSDPTNPVPWFVGALGAVVAAAVRRRSRSA